MDPAVAGVETWLSAAPEAGRAWLAEARAKIAAGDERALLIAFGLAPRKLGKAPLVLDAAKLGRAQQLAPGLDPRRWSADQVARTLLVLALPSIDAERWLATLDRLFAAAALPELVALYQALPLLPHGEALAPRAAEGIRSSMRAVFEAVALGNPFPAAHLDEGAWNQMVLKCLFMESGLSRVVGLERRANPRLTRMLCDYAHERWAAKRSVSPELWRPVGHSADEAALDDLARVLADGSAAERTAAALALRDAGTPAALARLERAPDLREELDAERISWSTVAEAAS
jgi:hypothetical protein